MQFIWYIIAYNSKFLLYQFLGQKEKADGKDAKEPVNNSGIPDIIDPKDLEQPPAVVIYIVDPFVYGEDCVEEFSSVTTLGLLKCFTEIFGQLSATLKRNIVLQVW